MSASLRSTRPDGRCRPNWNGSGSRIARVRWPETMRTRTRKVRPRGRRRQSVLRRRNPGNARGRSATNQTPASCRLCGRRTIISGWRRRFLSMRKLNRGKLGWLGVALAALVTRVGVWEARGDEDANGSRAVYALTNEPNGNRLAVFARHGRGLLTPAALVPTGGVGSGQNTHSQGGLAFSDDQKTIYAV